MMIWLMLLQLNGACGPLNGAQLSDLSNSDIMNNARGASVGSITAQYAFTLPTGSSLLGIASDSEFLYFSIYIGTALDLWKMPLSTGDAVPFCHIEDDKKFGLPDLMARQLFGFDGSYFWLPKFRRFSFDGTTCVEAAPVIVPTSEAFQVSGFEMYVLSNGMLNKYTLNGVPVRSIGDAAFGGRSWQWGRKNNRGSAMGAGADYVWGAQENDQVGDFTHPLALWRFSASTGEVTGWRDIGDFNFWQTEIYVTAPSTTQVALVLVQKQNITVSLVNVEGF